MKKIVYLFALLTLTLGLEGQNFHFEKVATLEEGLLFRGLSVFNTQAFALTDETSYFYNGESFEQLPYFINTRTVSGFEKNDGSIFAASLRGNSAYNMMDIYLWQPEIKQWQKVFESENQCFQKTFVLNEDSIYLCGYDENYNQNGYIYLFNPKNKVLKTIIQFNNQNYINGFMVAKNHNNIFLYFGNSQKKLWQKYNGENIETLYTFENEIDYYEIKSSPDTSTFFFLSFSREMMYYWKENEQKMDSIDLEIYIESFFPLDNENLMIFSSEGAYTFNIKNKTPHKITGTEYLGMDFQSGYTGKGNAFLIGKKNFYKITIVGSSNQFKEIDNISFYPNPVNNILWIDCPIEGEKNIKIIDLKGQILTERFFNSNNLNLNTSDLSPGVYIVQIKSIKGITNQKLIKN